MSIANNEQVKDYSQYPDERGHFGRFGGLFVAETLMGPLQELREAYEKYSQDEEFALKIKKSVAGRITQVTNLDVSSR